MVACQKENRFGTVRVNPRGHLSPMRFLYRRRRQLVDVGIEARLRGRFNYLLVESTSEPPPSAEPRLGRRTALTFPLFPPPQKN
ncbi:MAG: hypothetical protein JWO19_1403 [Bryobacterales bacterium]|nr:hypothetical protein [Bryobacterales bacterium]